MPADTTLAIDQVFNFFLIFSVVAGGLTVAVMIFFLFRYHHSRNPKPSDIRGNTGLEIIWIVIPTLIGIVMFWIGWGGFSFVTQASPDAMEVDVEASQFAWDFEYENGASSQELRVPLGQEVLLNITSADVIHSFYAPEYRIKMDAVPGMTTRVRFTAQEPGSYDVFCAEYCGLGHSSMDTEIIVLSESEFEQWYQENAPQAAAASSE